MNKKIMISIFFGLLIPMQNFSMMDALFEKINQCADRMFQGLDNLDKEIGPDDLFSQPTLLQHTVVQIPSEQVNNSGPTEIDTIVELVMWLCAALFVREAADRSHNHSTMPCNISSLQRLADVQSLEQHRITLESTLDSQSSLKIIRSLKTSLITNQETTESSLQGQTLNMPRSESEESVTSEETRQILSSGIFHTISSEAMIDRLNSPSPTPKNNRQDDGWVVVSDVGRNEKIN